MEMGASEVPKQPGNTLWTLTKRAESPLRSYFRDRAPPIEATCCKEGSDRLVPLAVVRQWLKPIVSPGVV